MEDQILQGYHTLLNLMESHGINDDIKLHAIEFRKKYNLKTADSIIAATAYDLGIPLLSADQIFNRVEEINFILYTN